MKLKFPDPFFKKRIIAATIFVTILVSATIFSQWTYFFLYLLILIISLLEFYKIITCNNSKPNKYWGCFCSIFLYTALYFYARNILDSKYLLIAFPILFLLFPNKLYDKTDSSPFISIAKTILGIIYISIPFSMIHFITYTSYFYNYELILGIIFITWINDTMAYLIGSLFGKTRLFSRISPKKSWEGSIGGAIFSILLAIGISYFYKTVNLSVWVLIGIITVVMGIYGDLVESMLKRSVNIKDSGNIMPGHGGILDRFDSFILIIPFVVVFIKLIL
jgi:phosphatidate cytidylyltransferase